jgi:hypothetical protein
MSVPEAEQRKVFARSGNRCAFAECRRILTADASPPDRIIVLGEIAHIVAERLDGPRGHSPLALLERNRAENLILLCNNHHQLIDSQPHTYSVDRLLAMKEAHERWVDKTLGDGKRQDVYPNGPRVQEVVHSTLLPVERMPAYVYGVPCSLEERDVQPLLGRLRAGEMAPYIVRGKKLYASQHLAQSGNPFEAIVGKQHVDAVSVEQWWSDTDRLAWFVQLLNRTLNKLTGRRGLQLDRDHHRYYFAAEQPGVPVSVQYKPLNKQRASRTVVWQPKKRTTGEPRPYWFHRAVALRFVRIGERGWALSIRPELRVTVDGMQPPAPQKIGGRVTRKKSRTFNYDLLAEVQFWRDYLSASQPRIVLPFGQAHQVIVISTTLMRGDVTWPGIPKEHAKPFKNVEYVDDLFTWAESRSFDDSQDAENDGDWLDDEEELDDAGE